MRATERGQGADRAPGTTPNVRASGPHRLRTFVACCIACWLDIAYVLCRSGFFPGLHGVCHSYWLEPTTALQIAREKRLVAFTTRSSGRLAGACACYTAPLPPGSRRATLPRQGLRPRARASGSLLLHTVCCIASGRVFPSLQWLESVRAGFACACQFSLLQHTQ